MTLRLLADENIPALEDCLGEFASIERFMGRALTAEQVRDADALFVRSVTRVDESLLAGSNVKFVGTATSGLDHIDIEYLQSADIQFIQAIGANANAVTEYVLTAIAACDDYLERLLGGAEVGVVGYGHVGRMLVARLSQLGIGYRVFDPWLDSAVVPGCASLDAVLDAQVVTLHCELTQRAPWPSHHLLGAEELGKLASGSLLINASRGPVVDNSALLKVLEQRDDLNVVLDVWEGEPRIDERLLRLARIGSAHIAGYSDDAKVGATALLCEGLLHTFGESSAKIAPPVPPAQAVTVRGDAELPQLLRALLSSRYDIMADDAKLRAVTLDAPSERAASAFDALRRSYSSRREVAGSAVRASRLSAAAQRALQAFECQIQDL